MVKDVYPAEEQGIEKEETEEKVKQDMEEGEKEADVYTKEGREKLSENDEISPGEEGFTEGEDDIECKNCGQLIDQEDAIIATDSDGKKHYFCSEECAEEFEEK